MAKKKKYNPISYVKTKNPGKYKSAYTGQLKAAMRDLNAARANVLNFQYDPLQDASYQALAQVYGNRGNMAAKDTLADAAMLNGGMQTSYAVSAAQQARNQYNQELAALVPDLEANAYNRLQTNYGLLQDNYNLLMDADNNAYARYRDQISDYQWGKGYDTDIYQYRQQQAKANSGGGGGGGGGRRGGGGGGSYSGGGSSSSSDKAPDIYGKVVNAINGGNKSGTGNPNSVMAYQSSGGTVKNQNVGNAVARNRKK